MGERIRYSDSTDRVLQTLNQLRMKGACPILFCVPDILVLRQGQVDEIAEGERFEGAPALYDLDGHACISAMTAAYLCLGLASEYSVLLAVKAGVKGRQLLGKLMNDFRLHGCNLFRYFMANGDDREIQTLRDTSDEVTRRIDPPDEGNQLSWEDLDTSYCLRWLERKNYGLVIGDAESHLVRHGEPERIQSLINNAVTTVIDTLAWKGREDKDERNRELWTTITSVVTEESYSFISISGSDAISIAAALGFELEDNASRESVCRQLAYTLKAGFLVLHEKDVNMIFSCPVGEELARVPACDITPVSTNGAGDTFNGALALAATALLFDAASKGDVSPPSPETLKHILAFATAVVSLRLQSGHYVTRAKLLSEAKHLRPKNSTIPEADSLPAEDSYEQVAHEDTISLVQQLAHTLAPFWSDVPRLALIDLDHTLCDSKKWRLAATMAGFESLLRDQAFQFRRDEQSLESLYEKIYQDHAVWEHIIHKNVRYQWDTYELFELAIAIDTILRFDEYDTERLLSSEMIRGIELERARIHQSGTVSAQVSRAVNAFKAAPAFPYPDSIAGLYQLRDILGFKLLIVTEGNFQTQCWKLDKLGLKTVFPPHPDIVYTEDALASDEQFDSAFIQASYKHKDDKSLLDEAQEICKRIRESLKSSWRAEAFRAALEKNGANSTGVHTCTIGDRIDTDVIPYIDIRNERPQEGEYGGLVIGRLKRGQYIFQEPTGPGDTPDMTVASLPEFVTSLAESVFWRHDPTILNIKKLKLPRLTYQERESLRRAAALDTEVSILIETLLKNIS